MRVAIDTNGLFNSQAGVARYIRGLLRGLRRSSIPGLEITELAWAVESFSYRQPERGFKTLYREFVWARWVAPQFLARTSAELLHSTGSYIIYPPASTRSVVTLHDIAVVRHPERFRRWHRFSEERRLRRVARADRIITVSQFSADEAMDLLGLPASQIDVVHNGCDFVDERDIPDEEKPAWALPSEFVLFVGSLEPGKNLGLIRQAYEWGASQGRRLPPLVIVGARWQGVAGEGAPPPDWHYAGRLSDAQLVYLYRRALALAFPSKYEGFGLPVAEAMALGCPVVCSRVASMPEVGGEAAFYAEAEPKAYHTALTRLASDPAFRSELIQRGLQQSRRFSWERCAAATAAVYASALSA